MVSHLVFLWQQLPFLMTMSTVSYKSYGLCAHDPPPTHTTAATISLEQTSYIVREGEGSVMVCAAITEGQLYGVVGVQLATMEGTASKTNF